MIRPWIDIQRRFEAATREAVRIIAERPGPAVCTQRALCYWTGKDIELDPLNFTFGVAARIKDLGAVLRQVAFGYCGTFVILSVTNREATSLLPRQLIAEIKSHPSYHRASASLRRR